MSILSKWRKAEADELEAKWRTYRALLTKHAGKNTITERQLTALREAATVLNRTPAQIETDLTVTHEAASCEQAARVDLAAATEASKAASAAVQKHIAETKRIAVARQAELKMLKQRRAAAVQESVECQTAARRLRELRRDHWRLLGCEPPQRPNTESGRRNLDRAARQKRLREMSEAAKPGAIVELMT